MLKHTTFYTKKQEELDQVLENIGWFDRMVNQSRGENLTPSLAG